MNRYECYKDSGVEWLGEVPSHWEFEKIKYSCQIFNGDSLNENQKKLYSSENKSHLPYISSKDVNLNFSTIDYDNGLRIPLGDKFKIAPKNSILLCIEGGSAGRKLAFTNQDVNFVNKLACFKSNRKTCSKFIFYSLKGIIFQSQFFNSMTGLIGGVSISSIENFNLLFPPLPEQQKIAEYLDDKIAKIDQAIILEEKQIELLKEHKQILIQNAVTKGLNPQVKFKDSGVEWLGEVPEHWEVKKIKTFSKINNGLDYKSVMAEEGYPVFGSGGQFAYAKTYLYDGEAILLGRKGTIDKPLYINDKFWTVDTMFYCICNHQVYAKFIYYCCCSVIPFQYYSTSTALPSMTQSDILNHKITLPPLSEQTAIAQYLDEQTAKIDHAIQLKQQQIDKLKEYKTVLINDVVTGKVKVA